MITSTIRDQCIHKTLSIKSQVFSEIRLTVRLTFSKKRANMTTLEDFFLSESDLDHLSEFETETEKNDAQKEKEEVEEIIVNYNDLSISPENSEIR